MTTCKQIGAPHRRNGDNLHAQLGQLKKWLDLQGMVGRVEAAMSTVPAPAIAEGSALPLPQQPR
ncbi:MAG: hypothetical protein U0744_12645 [Gemmataceae bacterium]